MTTMASQITSLTVVFSTLNSDADQRKHQRPRHWPLCGEFTGACEFPAQRASYAENVSIWWRHHVCSVHEENNTTHKSLHICSLHVVCDFMDPTPLTLKCVFLTVADSFIDDFDCMYVCLSVRLSHHYTISLSSKRHERYTKHSSRELFAAYMTSS